LEFDPKSIDGKSNMPKQLMVRDRQEYLKDAEVKWSTTSLEIDVSHNSQVLSFGADTKNGEPRVRNDHR
jgi:aldehyde:ferredoxin oxidoreductase